MKHHRDKDTLYITPWQDAPRIIRSWWDLIFFKREKPWNDNPTSMALHDVNTETRDVSEGLATKHATTLVHVSPECGH